MEDAVPPLCLEIMEFSPRPGCNPRDLSQDFRGVFVFSLLTCWEAQPTLPIFGRRHENFFIAWRYLLDFGCGEVISPRQNSLDYAAGLCHSSFQSYRSRLDWRKLTVCLHYLWLMVSISAVTLHETNIAPELLGLEDEFPFGEASWKVLCVFFFLDVIQRQSSIVAANQLHPSQALQVHKTIIPK